MATPSNQKWIWFGLSLLIATSYSLLALQEALSAEYIVQDDARQHVFWMLRFIESDFFPNDLIADYFQSVAPTGYSTLYGAANRLGVHPFIFNKCLPLILDLITTSYCFFFSFSLFPVPFAAFLSSLFLNQYLWLRDDLVSATPTAFIYPLLLAFLYYLAKRSFFSLWISLALLGLFYPQGLLVATGVLVLSAIRNKTSSSMVEIIGLSIAFCVMLFYAMKSSQYDPVITAEQAKMMPEFLAGGTSEFFVSGFWQFWLNGKRSGIMPQFAAIVIGLILIFSPWFLVKTSWFPLRKQIKPEAILLTDLTIASVGLFFLSHLLLFQLHLPSRYTEHSLRIISAIALAIALTLILDALLNWNIKQHSQRLRLPKRKAPVLTKAPVTVGQLSSLISLGVSTIFLIGLVIYPTFFEEFPETNYIQGNYPQLYQLLENTPKETVIASTTPEANQLPTFAKRSILVGSEGYPVPYQLGYYQQIQERTMALINAQYSPHSDVVQTFIEKYSINFWLLERSAFSAEYIGENNWLMQYQPAANRAIENLNKGIIPFLKQQEERCITWEEDDLYLLDTRCLY